MSHDAPSSGSGCCAVAGRCVFAKAVLTRQVGCDLAGRRAVGEALHVVCTDPVAQDGCDELARLLRERARFALRLPRPEAPLRHVDALRLQCGGLRALAQALEVEPHHVAHLVALARGRYGSLEALPWSRLVTELAAWQPRRRSDGDRH